MHRLLKSLAKHRAQRYRVTFSAAEEAGLIAREAGALRRELSMTFQDALLLYGALFHWALDMSFAWSNS